MVSAASATERQEWISHIEECVRGGSCWPRACSSARRPRRPGSPTRCGYLHALRAQTRFSALTRGTTAANAASWSAPSAPGASSCRASQPQPLRVCSLCFRGAGRPEPEGRGREAGPRVPGPSAYLAGAVCGASSGGSDDSRKARGPGEGSGDGDWPSPRGVLRLGEVSWSSFLAAPGLQP